MRIFIILFSFLLTCAPAMAQDTAPVTAWSVSYNQSELAFHGKQMAIPFKGVAGKYAADIRFDPERLEDSRVTVDIDTASLSTGDKDRDKTITTKEWFDTAKYPSARFESGVFKKQGDGSFTTEGNLTIKDKSVPVILSFTVEFIPMDSGNKKALVKGKSTVKRTDFALGTGDWADTSVITNDVDITLDLIAFSKAE